MSLSCAWDPAERQIVENLGGGEVRIDNRAGRFRDSDATKHGHESKRRDTK
jgi:hypothetical protein